MKIQRIEKWRFDGLWWSFPLIQPQWVLLFDKYTAHGHYSSHFAIAA